MSKLLLVLMMFAVSVGGCMCANPTQGKKIGMITSLSDEGIVCKTHEGVLQRGGINSGSGTVGQQITFNIKPGDVDLLDQARDAMESGAEVELTFSRPWVSSICSRENAEDVIVSAITPVKNAPKPPGQAPPVQ